MDGPAETAQTRTAIIDTDPGIDDAIAILLALSAPPIDVRGITTVAGNLGLRTTTRNACRLLALAGRADIPVHPGADRPLMREPPASLDLHGRDGVGGILLPEPVHPAAAQPAVAFLADALAAAPEGSVDLLALGPLTNVAALLRDHPQAARRIGRIIAMGGAVRTSGNAGGRAEFNMAADPEAAALVLGAGLPLTLIPLDVTRRVRADRAFAAALRSPDNPRASAAGALIDAYFAEEDGPESRPLHDPCVMLYALDPSLFGCERLSLAVDTGEGPDAGALTPGPSAPPVEVALTVDASRALALLGDLLRLAPGR